MGDSSQMSGFPRDSWTSAEESGIWRESIMEAHHYPQTTDLALEGENERTLGDSDLNKVTTEGAGLGVLMRARGHGSKEHMRN